jgi:hypothetical protein
MGIFASAFLVTLTMLGALELAVSHKPGIALRFMLIGASAAVVGLAGAALSTLAIPAVHDHAPPWVIVLMAGSAAVVALAGGWAAAYAPHTRASAVILLALGLAAVARLAAWVAAARAADAAGVALLGIDLTSIQLFGIGRAFATVGVLFEACAQSFAIMWLGTRSRTMGQLGAFAAVLGAYAVMYGVAHGGRSGAAVWEAVLHGSLADAPGLPAPYGLEVMATFLVPASLLLALVCAAQPKQVVTVVAPLSLALISRGALDAPIRALCISAAAHWTVLACIDDRAMWRTLIDDRNRRNQEA